MKDDSDNIILFEQMKWLLVSVNRVDSPLILMLDFPLQHTWKFKGSQRPVHTILLYRLIKHGKAFNNFTVYFIINT